MDSLSNEFAVQVLKDESERIKRLIKNQKIACVSHNVRHLKK